MKSNKAISSNINLKKKEKQISRFSKKWLIQELALFGSVLGTDFNTQSDVDVLITFKPDIPWSSFDWIDMIEELSVIFAQKVDLVEKSSLRNPYRKKHILENMQVIYEEH